MCWTYFFSSICLTRALSLCFAQLRTASTTRTRHVTHYFPWFFFHPVQSHLRRSFEMLLDKVYSVTAVLRIWYSNSPHQVYIFISKTCILQKSPLKYTRIQTFMIFLMNLKINFPITFGTTKSALSDMIFQIVDWFIDIFNMLKTSKFMRLKFYKISRSNSQKIQICKTTTSRVVSSSSFNKIHIVHLFFIPATSYFSRNNTVAPETSISSHEC